MSPPLLALLLAVLLLTLNRFRRIGQRPEGCPPGPPTLPLLGNLHQINPNNTHKQFQKWAEEYGPIFSLVMGTKILIVLSSDQVVKDLLDLRGNIYSSRPNSYITNVATNGLNLVMMQYNNTWRMCHKIMHTSLNARAVKAYIPYQDLETKAMLKDFLEQPELFVSHIRRYTSSLTTQICFGFRTIDKSDPNLLQLYEEFERWSQLTRNAFAVLVDFYPPLRLLPDFLLPLRQTARQLFRSENRLFLRHWNNIVDKLRDGTAPPCFASEVFQAQKAEGFSDDQAAHLCGIVLEAGSETTATELTAFLQAMILFPEVQKTAQAELDRICGDRLPTIEDLESLRYIRATVKEVCRWMPAVFLGIPHSVTRDDEYNAFKIPKDALVTINVWSIHMDPGRYEDPHRFDPSRFLNNEKSARQSALVPNPKNRDHFVFGAGRRLCPGLDLAENSLFLGFSRLLWAFNFGAPEDDQSNPILPNPEDIVGGLPVQIKPFRAKIEARNEQRARDVKLEWEAVKLKSLDEKLQWRAKPCGMNNSDATVACP